MHPYSKDLGREHRSEGGRRATSSRVPANPNVSKKGGEGLTDTRSARKADGSRVMMFRKVRPYQQSTREIVQYQRVVLLETPTLLINQD